MLEAGTHGKDALKIEFTLTLNLGAGRRSNRFVADGVD